MASLNDLTALREKVERLQRNADKAQGALDQTMKALSEEFGCDTVEDAQRKLKRLERDEASAKEDFETALKKFNTDWKDELVE